MSTLLSELDSSPASGDGDFVQSILNEMNGGPPPPQPPPASFSQGMINAPNPNTVAPHAMDNGPITAHMIGNSHPTPADLTQIMNTHVVAAPQGGGGMGGAAYQQAPQPPIYAPIKRSWLSRTADDLRSTISIVILVFVFSLPIVNFLFAHYLPWTVKSTGELTWIGLLVKSVLAGITFWILQRVVVPLLSV